MRIVLLIIQSEEFRFAMREALQEHYCVIAAHDIASGADLLQDKPDILFLDLFLPGTDGFRFMEENRNLLPPTVLLFTTLINPQILRIASDLGVNAIFRTPCSISAVLKQLKQI